MSFDFKNEWRCTFTPPIRLHGQFTFTFAFYGQLRSITCTQNNTRDCGVLITRAETTHALVTVILGLVCLPVLSCVDAGLTMR
jgi:hypothetical protein